METAVRPKHPPMPASLGHGIWQTASWNDPETVYQQDLAERTCTCPAGLKGYWCKHLTGALIASFTLQLKKAKQADGRVVRRLLARGDYQGRTDIEMALLLAAWHDNLADWERLQAETPGEEPEPEPVPPAPAAPGLKILVNAAEYQEGARLLSEGRKVAA